MSNTPIAAVDRTERSGSPVLVVLLALFLVGSALAFSFLPHDQAARLIVGLLAVLSVIGVFALFAYSVGLLQFAGQATRNDVTKAIADTGQDGLIVTDADAHYARAVAAGATIVIDIADQPYGGRGYACKDPEGHHWWFGSYDPWAEPAQA